MLSYQKQITSFEDSAFTQKAIYDGKTALVTGGSSGIGKAVCQLFLRTGMRVYVLDTKIPETEEAVPNLHFLHTDVSDKNSCTEAAQKISRAGHHLSTIVNAAGIVRVDSKNGASETLPELLKVNLIGTAHVCEAFLSLFKSEGGTIVNVGSIVATFGWPQRAAYCASKGAVESMTRALALEYISKNIRVNALAPGLVDTPLIQEVIARSEDPEHALRSRAELQATGRLITAEEIAHSVFFLATEQSSALIGATLDCSAGRLAGHVPH